MPTGRSFTNQTRSRLSRPAKLSPTRFPSPTTISPPARRHARSMSRPPDQSRPPRKAAINGLLSLTPDGGAIIGETPEVHGLWSAAAVWIKEGRGRGPAVLAELITNGDSQIDPHEGEYRALPPLRRTRRTCAGPDVRGIHQDLRDHPSAGSSGTQRPHPPAPARACRATMNSERCSSRPPAGSDPNGTNPTLTCSRSSVKRIWTRSAEWDARWWSPIINAEHLACANGWRRGPRSFAILDVTGPGALDRPKSSRSARST